jgi:hypothetical protein
VTVTATATADPTKQASATITVTAATLNNSLLQGQYAFLLSGVQAEGTSALAGSLIADGNGNITAAEESLPGQSPSLVTGITGAYFVGSDGRGLITLSGLPAYDSAWLYGQQMFAIAVVDPTHAWIEEFDGSGPYNIASSPPLGSWYGRTLQGELELQQTSDFGTPPSGPYAFAWPQGGPALSLSPCSSYYVCAAYYGGVLNADASGNVTSFSMDRYVDGSTESIASGAYGSQSFSVPDSFGHGTVTVGPYSLDYFLVNSGEMLVTASSSLDQTGFPAGHIYSQSSGATSPAGTYVFTLAGSTPIYFASGANVIGSSPEAAGGWFTCDSSGNVSGFLDTNNNGVVESSPVSGTLAPSAIVGRWNLTLNGGEASQFAIYPTSNRGLLMFQLDTRKSGTGIALIQAVPSPALQGMYSANVQQLGIIDVARNLLTVGQPTGSWTDISGQVVASNSSTITGTVDIDQVNGEYLGPCGNLWTQSPGQSITGNFTAGTGGRDTGTITTNQLGTVGGIFYVVDGSTVMLFEDDATPAIGILRLQNF